MFRMRGLVFGAWFLALCIEMNVGFARSFSAAEAGNMQVGKVKISGLSENI